MALQLARRPHDRGEKSAQEVSEQAEGARQIAGAAGARDSAGQFENGRRWRGKQRASQVETNTKLRSSVELHANLSTDGRRLPLLIHGATAAAAAAAYLQRVDRALRETGSPAII